MKNNEPLKVTVVDGELIISVGVDTLAQALEKEDPWLGYQIVNTKNFTKSLIQEITKDHDGRSWITDMFVSAATELKGVKLDIKDEKDQWWALKLKSDKEVTAMVTKIS